MKIKIGIEDVELSADNLKITEIGLNDYLCNFAAIYDYYSRKWSEAQYLHYVSEDKYDCLYCDKFRCYKEDGCSDKLAEARSKSNHEVIDARNAVRKAKLTMQLIYGYLRALDKSHENALNLGYNLRREMSHLFSEVKDRNIDQITRADDYFKGNSSTEL